MTAVRLRPILVTCAVGIVAMASCRQDERIGADLLETSHAGAGGAGASPAVDASTDGRVPGCVPVECQPGKTYACGDCRDNDGDHRVDMDDPDCFGPCHNSESTFYGSIPGQNHAACADDCYFDQDSGSGNDGCMWSRTCDPLEVAPAFSPGGAKCAYDPATRFPRGQDCAAVRQTQDAQCADVCGPLVPNGCDCFGCCEIPGAPTTVWLGSADDAGNGTCDLAHLADPTRCRPCTRVEACTNPCDTCERCIGKPNLPASCSPGSLCQVPVCVRGEPCGADCLPPCPTGESCVTGCCVSPPR